MHDASKFLMGSTNSSCKLVSDYGVDPASFPAGLAVSIGSGGDLSLLKSAGRRVGVSAGRSLSNIKRTSVIRAGLGVPVKLALKRATGIVTISSYANLVSGTPDSITVGTTVFTAQSSAIVAGQATFRASSDNNTTAASLASQINAHATAGALVFAKAASAVVTLYARAGGAAGNNIAVAYTDNDTNVGAVLSGLSGGKLSGGSDLISGVDYVVKGAKVYFNDVLGLADFATVETTISDAVYVSGVLTGTDEDGNDVPCALVDMQGGL